MITVPIATTAPVLIMIDNAIPLLPNFNDKTVSNMLRVIPFNPAWLL